MAVPLAAFAIGGAALGGLEGILGASAQNKALQATAQNAVRNHKLFQSQLRQETSTNQRSLGFRVNQILGRAAATRALSGGSNDVLNSIIAKGRLEAQAINEGSRRRELTALRSLTTQLESLESQGQSPFLAGIKGAVSGAITLGTLASSLQGPQPTGEG